jgi:hypothetical protein
VEVLRFWLLVERDLVLKEPQTSEKERSMQYYTGLDVSVKDGVVAALPRRHRNVPG